MHPGPMIDRLPTVTPGPIYARAPTVACSPILAETSTSSEGCTPLARVLARNKTAPAFAKASLGFLTTIKVFPGNNSAVDGLTTKTPAMLFSPATVNFASSTNESSSRVAVARLATLVISRSPSPTTCPSTASAISRTFIELSPGNRDLIQRRLSGWTSLPTAMHPQPLVRIASHKFFNLLRERRCICNRVRIIVAGTCESNCGLKVNPILTQFIVPDRKCRNHSRAGSQCNARYSAGGTRQMSEERNEHALRRRHIRIH